MSQKQARRLLIGLCLLFAVAVTWPAATLANRFRPTFLGLPFNLVWVAAWIVIALVVLLVVDHRLQAGRSRPGPNGRP